MRETLIYIYSAIILKWTLQKYIVTFGNGIIMLSVELSSALLCKQQETSQFQKEGGKYLATLDVK
jgi:hypothetical protein